MNKTEKALVELLKIAKKQQEIIKKLAQVPVQSLDAKEFTTKNEAQVILDQMDKSTRLAVDDVWVSNSNVVKVKFKQGLGSDAAWAGVQNAVTQAQKLNLLPGASYQIEEVV